MKNSFELFSENSVQNLHHQAATRDKSKIVKAQPHNTGLLNEYVLLWAKCLQFSSSKNFCLYIN